MAAVGGAGAAAPGIKQEKVVSRKNTFISPDEIARLEGDGDVAMTGTIKRENSRLNAIEELQNLPQ